MSKRSRLCLRLLVVCIAACLVLFSVFLFSLRTSRKHYAEPERAGHGIQKRRVPYPFRSAVAICSDIDGTGSLGEFVAIQEFLNTQNETDMGRGLGLEIGNSIIPGETIDHKDGPEAAYSIENELVVDLIKAGYIDCVHSFNEASRDEARHIVNSLLTNACSFGVWVNHAHADTNLGDHRNACGDNSGSDHYHTDFSVRGLGINFVWKGDVTGMVGQGVPLRLRSFFAGLDQRHVARSLVNNCLKEIAKYSSAVLGMTATYAARKHNDLVYPFRLDDGQYAFAFVRSNVSYEGTGRRSARAVGLPDTLRQGVFKELNHVGGFMIVYTHLGVNDGYPYISDEVQKALRRLEAEYRDGRIYVTTTAKLLTYYTNSKYLVWHADASGGKRYVHISSVSDPVRGNFVPSVDDLRGITFYTDDPKNTHILIGNREIDEINVNEPDYTNTPSVTIRLKPLPRMDEKIEAYRRRHLPGLYHGVSAPQ